MARGRSGAIERQAGGIILGPVTIADRRVEPLRQFLVDLSRPGLCIVLGAGASWRVVPATPTEITNRAWKLLQSQRSFLVLSQEDQRMLAAHPEVGYLKHVLGANSTNWKDRLIVNAMTPSRAVLTLNDVFSPQVTVPRALTRIYDFFDPRDGTIVSYNYDGIADQQSRFPVIAPHGRRPSLLADPGYASVLRDLADMVMFAPPTDWYLPVPEKPVVRQRSGYQEMLRAWRTARTIVFVGYGFGGGADALSLEDFGEALTPRARVHVLCPPSSNAELCERIGRALGTSPRERRVFGQPVGWKHFAEGFLEVLDGAGASHVRLAIGREAEILQAHDRRSS
jgi:hypothetical protein